MAAANVIREELAAKGKTTENDKENHKTKGPTLGTTF